jgi:hypothetical protein
MEVFEEVGGDAVQGIAVACQVRGGGGVGVGGLALIAPAAALGRQVVE